MTVMSSRTIEPIHDFGNQVYLVTILTLDVFRAQKRVAARHSLRGKYRGYLSSADEFARNKQV